MQREECSSVSVPLSPYLSASPSWWPEERWAWLTQVQEGPCAALCVPVDEKASTNEEKGLDSHIFFIESEKSIHDLKEVYEFLA